MPGFNGKGPRGSGRSGRGMGPGSGAGGGGQMGPRRGRNTGEQENQDYIQNAERTHPYIYQYSLEELRERKQELEKEIKWLDDRIKELETSK